MKRILILLLGLFSVAYGQFAPTSAKSAFKWGVSIGTRDSTAYAANDSLVVVINRQGRMMYRSTDGYWKLLANAASSDFVPYTGAVTNVNLGNYRLTARSVKTDSVYANTSAGMYLATNSGSVVAHWGGGGSVEVDFKGFAGYDANRAGSYTARSFTDKNYVDSSDGLRVRYTDTAAMLAPYFRDSDTTGLLNNVVRTFGTQTIGGNKTFSNDIIVNSINVGRGGTPGGFLANTNLSVGSGALISNNGGFYNTAIGTSALGSNSTGQSNTGIGRVALENNTTGNNNTAVGNNAGTTVNGGSNNVFLGASALPSSTSNSNEIVIGASTTGNGSNTVTIGNSSVTDNYFSGNIRGGAFIRSGGTSSQFLKADGSVDGTAYGTGSVTSVSAGTGMSFTTITSTGAVNADTTTLATRAYVVGLDVGKANTSLNNVNGVLSSTYGGAGSVSGILKANGSGVVSAASAGDIPNLSGTYVDLTTNQTVGGVKTFSSAVTGTSGINITGADATNSVLYRYVGGTNNPGLFVSTTEATNTVNLSALGSVGGTILSISSPTTFSGQINGTSLSMSGGGSFGSLTYVRQNGSSYGMFRVVNTVTNGEASIGFRDDSDSDEQSWAIGKNLNSSTSDDFGWYRNGATRMTLTTNSELLINTTTTDGTNKLIVNGGVKFGTGGTATIASTGAATFSSSVTATGFIVSSDRRLKNIIKRDGDVAYYKWKDKQDDKVHIGYIAQEVQKTNPDQVSENNGKLAVNYIEILVEKVRALEKEIEQLKRKQK